MTATTAMPPDGPAAARFWPDDLYPIACGVDGACEADGSATVARIGSKAHGLLKMAQAGLPVPPAFVLGTRYCIADRPHGEAVPEAVRQTGLECIERATGQRFGDARKPLLLAVRSGAPVSMPGMLETLLDIGLCDATVPGFLRATGNPRLVWDTYRRLVAHFGELVAGIAPDVFETEQLTLTGGRDPYAPLDFAQLRALTSRFLEVYEREAGEPFPQDPQRQLAAAIDAVLDSWHAGKAVAFRRQYGIGDDMGTAVTVQAMAFGNSGGRSGAGVGFTRDPCSGEPTLWVDFLFNAQGEDVVSGRRRAHGHETLSRVMPAVWDALCEAAKRLEQVFADMQDFEFTVQDGRLYLLQSRSGKRTPVASARIALDLCDEGIIDVETAHARTAAIDMAALVTTHVVGAGGGSAQPLAWGDPASDGVAAGEIVLDEAAARARHAAGVPVILVRQDADTGQLAAMREALGIVTQRGARTSHAAVVARQLGKVCLVGARTLRVDEAARTIELGGRVMCEGDWLTLDGNDGAIYAGKASTRTEPLSALQARLAALRLARRREDRS